MTAGWRIDKESEGWAEASAVGFGLAWQLPGFLLVCHCHVTASV